MADPLRTGISLWKQLNKQFFPSPRNDPQDEIARMVEDQFEKYKKEQEAARLREIEEREEKKRNAMIEEMYKKIDVLASTREDRSGTSQDSECSNNFTSATSNDTAAYQRNSYCRRGRGPFSNGYADNFTSVTSDHTTTSQRNSYSRRGRGLFSNLPKGAVQDNQHSSNFTDQKMYQQDGGKGGVSNRPRGAIQDNQHGSNFTDRKTYQQDRGRGHGRGGVSIRPRGAVQDNQHSSNFTDQKTSQQVRGRGHGRGRFSKFWNNQKGKPNQESMKKTGTWWLLSLAGLFIILCTIILLFAWLLPKEEE